MTAHTNDNTNFWRLAQAYILAGVKDNYGTNPLVPTEAMLRICQRISNKTNQ